MSVPPSYDNQSGEIPTWQQSPPPQPSLASFRRETPVVVYVIMGLTVTVYLLQMLTEFAMGGIDLPAALGMKVNDLIVQGQLWRLFTPMLLHGSLLHIGFNMYALYALGPGLESYYGHQRFLLLYVLAGFAGNVLSFLFSPANSLGSSTAIFGLLGAQAVFLLQNKSLFGSRAQRALTNIAMVAALNLWIGLSSPGIDNWGHLGGLLGGVIFSWFAGPRLAVEGLMGTYSLVDQRQKPQVIMAAVLVAGLFAALATAAILF
jgi:rhomboid protease GluP